VTSNGTPAAGPAEPATTAVHAGGPGGEGHGAIDTRRRVLDASVALFAEKGFRASSLDEIADAVGIRKASLYHYFPSKAALLDGVYREFIGGLMEVPTKDIEEILYPCQRMRLMVASSVRFHHENRAFLRIFWRERQELPDDAYSRIREREKRFEAFVESIIVDGQASGCFDPTLDPQLVLHSTLGMLTTVYRWPHPEHPSEEFTMRVIEHTRRVLLAGLGARCAHQPGVATASEHDVPADPRSES
jgi:AcrR family transcriptional regulator